MLKSLYDYAEEHEHVRAVLLDDSVDHQEAVHELESMGVETSRTSVRRARERLGVISPKTHMAPKHASSENVTRSATVSENDVSSEKVAVIIGDYQIGLHDRDFIDRQCEIIRDLKPDMVISTGDELDMTSVGSWVRGLPSQFDRTIHEERQIWVEEIAPQINEAAPDAEKRMCDSNHIRRLPLTIEKYLPGLRDAPELFVKNFLCLEELGWQFDEGPTEFLPGVVYSHGDDWGVTSRGQSTKFREVIKTRQANVVFGHSHQAGLYTTALGYGFNMDTRWALNVGHGMVLREAQYIKSTSPDWSRGIGIVRYDGERAHPELHLEIGGKIRVDGKTY